ncbi:MAG: VWA domain-containing protein [Prevotella sp.]|nr:VWA domain-containing protein [Prevotella sp.]
MLFDIEAYRQKAQEAIESVFNNEYHSSLGIPMPEVKMLLADDENYATGQYYITIDQTWQIHLNFGKLPVSYKEFSDEVKVLTRHEIEHYMCCPFDVISHFRMLKRIIDVYNRDFSSMGINIEFACGSISNQAADIIVDTKNFIRHPEDTLKSEINWIKKGADLRLCPRHNKLMFLTKEAIWGRSLEINETDSELMSIVNKLALKFKENGIEDKNSFLDKTEEYTKAFFELYIKDKLESKEQSVDQQQSAQQQSSQQGGQQQSSQQHGQQQGSPENFKPTNAGRPKDGNSNGSAFVFADPDKIKEAIEALAEETNVKQFSQILSIVGIGGMTEAQKEKLWFTINGAGIIPIEEYSLAGSKDAYTYPSAWRIGDPVDDLDLMLSFMTSPRIIPGLTTKKWEKSINDIEGVEKRNRDLLLVLDTSGSMKNVLDESSNMHQAVLAAYGIISYFEKIQGKIALIEFSERVGVNINWTDDYEDVRSQLLVNGQGGTTFPISAIRNTIDKSKNEIVTIIITDGELGNMQESLNYFREYIDNDNILYIFIIGQSSTLAKYERLKDIGAKVFQSNKAEEFCNMVMNDLN